MVTKRIVQSNKIDIVDVLKILRNKQIQGTKEQTTKTVEFFNDIFHPVTENIDSDKVDTVCCEFVSITSSDTLANLYPNILGEYRKTYQGTFQPIYAKYSNTVQYLSQPKSDSDVLDYSWGVSPTPEAKWGYISSSKSAPCPTMAGQWKVFHKDTKRWVVDKTIKVICTEK